jgi:type I restriction enzyme M protein
MPHGVLTCGGVDGTIRKNIIKDDLIEAVIGLAPNLFYGTDISPIVLIFNKSKTQERKQKILFIDASSKYEQSKNQNYLKDEDINDILSFYQEFQDKEGYAKVVSLQEIADNNYILSIKNYVTQPKVDIEAEIIKEIGKLHELEAERAKIESDMNECIRALRINRVD